MDSFLGHDGPSVREILVKPRPNPACTRASYRGGGDDIFKVIKDIFVNLLSATL